MNRVSPAERKKRLDKILHLITDKAMSNPEIAKATGLHRSVIRVCIRDLRPKIHVERWIKPRNHIVPVYRAGSKKDAPVPTEWDLLEEVE